MSRSESATKLAPMISDLGGRFMSDAVGFTRAAEMNLEPGVGVYLVGRFGVLGKVDADVVVASAVFIAPELLAKEWNTAMETADPATAAEVYTSIAVEFGRAHISEAPGLERWTELASRVVDGASPLGSPVFAGWRAMPRPDDLPGRAYLLAHILRELRFSLHATAVVAAGLDPRMSILCTPGTGWVLSLFGWPEPHPEPSEADRALRAAVEDTTNELSATTLAVLSDEEVEEFVSLTEAIVEAAV